MKSPSNVPFFSNQSVQRLSQRKTSIITQVEFSMERIADPITYLHAVLIVGYTPEYWIVKNSWGTTGWGNGCYIDIARNVGYQCGACGINCFASFLSG
uniref:Peptidase C1A papain C-terminal domain-containing protein n=1 Tax=Nelumbo nucifera TaxID=4432 RepID=A0A822XM67_NELNU|nr:TPA_asm: hypothetical protein HUJ06_021499 [Nelumbo nucifera]